MRTIGLALILATVSTLVRADSAWVQWQQTDLTGSQTNWMLLIATDTLESCTNAAVGGSDELFKAG